MHSFGEKAARKEALPTSREGLGSIKLACIAILAIGRGGLQSCEKSRLPHCLDNRLRDGGEVVGLTRRPRFTPQEDSLCSFLY
jgi:hypothetical protein